MPRISRAVAIGFPHHITQRGNYQQHVFEDEEDYMQYLHWLKMYSQKYSLKMWAYCLMNNHVHFVSVPMEKDSLAKTFNTLHMRYSQYYNKKKKASGHLWQSRFYSCGLDERHLYAAIRYVDSVGKPSLETNLYAYVGNNPVNDVDPLGLFGTKDCSYYQQACQTNGGFYECHVVQMACNFFPKNNETSNCIRQCLQEKHKKRQPEGVCSEKGQTGLGDFFSEHAACILGCFKNSQNPYNPKGPNLPDQDTRLY